MKAVVLEVGGDGEKQEWVCGKRNGGGCHDEAAVGLSSSLEVKMTVERHCDRKKLVSFPTLPG